MCDAFNKNNYMSKGVHSYTGVIRIRFNNVGQGVTLTTTGCLLEGLSARGGLQPT